MWLLDRLKSWWSTPTPKAPSSPSRRGFLAGFGALGLAAFALPALDAAVPSWEVAPWTGHLDARFDLVAQIERRAREEIMAAEDARILELLRVRAEPCPRQPSSSS